jgi:hypothetical protein
MTDFVGYNAIDKYEEIIRDEIDNNQLREYIVLFLRETNRALTTRWFRAALMRQKPEMVEWFDRIQLLL